MSDYESKTELKKLLNRFYKIGSNMIGYEIINNQNTENQYVKIITK
jgi:hypothetical protein